MDNKTLTVHLIHSGSIGGKYKKQIKRLRGFSFLAGVAIAFLISEVMERKRCEKVLEEEIDTLKDRIDCLEGNGGAADA